jgi:hypothetical protein
MGMGVRGAAHLSTRTSPGQPVRATYGLLPGAGGSAWYWHLVEGELRRRGHDVVAVDLPADDPQAGLAEYAEVALEAIADAPQLVLRRLRGPSTFRRARIGSARWAGSSFGVIGSAKNLNSLVLRG